MSTLTAAVVFFWLGAAIAALVTWRICRYDAARPTAEEIASYLDGVVEQEDYDARIRRNEAMLHDGGRRSMPRGNPGQPARISKMHIVADERRK